MENSQNIFTTVAIALMAACLSPLNVQADIISNGALKLTYDISDIHTDDWISASATSWSEIYNSIDGYNADYQEVSDSKYPTVSVYVTSSIKDTYNNESTSGGTASGGASIPVGTRSASPLHIFSPYVSHRSEIPNLPSYFSSGNSTIIYATKEPNDYFRGSLDIHITGELSDENASIVYEISHDSGTLFRKSFQGTQSINYTQLLYLDSLQPKRLDFNISTQVVSNNFFHEHATGLIWLDLLETVDLSVNDILGHVGNNWHRDFRYATRAEVLNLWDSFGLHPGDTTDSQDSPLWTSMEDFFDRLGKTDSYTRTDLLDGIIDPLTGSHLLADLGNMYMSWDIHSPGGQADVFPVQQDVWGFDVRDPGVGHYLVMRSNVPEPSTLLLMLTALSGFMLTKKKTIIGDRPRFKSLGSKSLGSE
ncbi:PEP-CTERM sorting domain-containing protein [endosymbiont of Lamellibrachia barhami]|uniref:PEP-CTERM sorting domain-containing protein n=1 Tax=endosymbiont of Lamellibrachia barhami TaxID=205975 RepID=UPI0015B12878|nr:PEP-CTERM sorting domain-containing protein [endosymbiont of Lamellibrachia barhami]